jgi:hypothetical protein
MATQLHSRQLSFSRDGRTLIAADADGVILVSAAQVATRIAIDDVHGAVGFADQVWIASGETPRLSRYRLDGERIDDGVALPLSRGAALIAAAAGPPAAMWTGKSALAVIEEPAGLATVPGPSGADLALPLTGRRWVTATGSRVVAPSGLSCELAAGTRVTAGALALDGSAAVLYVERPDGRELVMIGLANGRVQLRRPLPTATLRLAARRGLIGLQTELRRIAVFELRSGRVIGEIACEHDVSDFALDPDGQRIALREGETSLQLVSLAEAFAAAAAAVAVVADDEPELVSDPAVPSAAPAPAPVAAPVQPRLAIQRPLELRSLWPLEHVPPVERTVALARLDQETRAIGLYTLRAISVAWDSRRIGYGNEGQHPYEHEVAALLDMNGGFAREHLAAAREHLADHLAELAAIADLRSPATPVGELAIEHGLSPLAVDILLTIAAPALWSEAARLYGILANDPGRALVDEALVEQILGTRATRHELAAELDLRSPLVRLGIVTIEASRARPFAGLEVAPIVLARLRREVPDLGPGLTARSSERALEELAIAPNVIATALTALARSPSPARIAVRGRPGSGRRTLIASIAAEAGRALGILEVPVLPRTEQGLARAVRAGLRRAQLAGLLPCLVGLEEIAFGDRDSREAIVEVLRAHPGPLAIVLPAGEAAPLDAGHVTIDLPVLAESERLVVWRSALGDAGLPTAAATTLAARYRIGPGVVYRAIAATVERTRGDADAGEPVVEIERYIRQTRDSRIGAHAQRVERLGTWDSLVLPGDVLDSLHELVARVQHRQTVFETWGMDRTMATSRGLTALFSGPPGTGKTMVAGVIARELGLDLYRVDVSKLVSKWVGETERNLASIFDAAEDGQVILLFDEADSLFAKRTEVRSSNDRYANLEVNYLLQRLDTFEGIAILTTNANSAIDPAFKRRMSFRLSFPFPDEDTREQLWRAHLPPELPISGPLALDKLAHKYTLSGGYIRNACLRAAFLAARDGTMLSQQHLDRAVALEFAEVGKLSSTGTID